MRFVPAFVLILGCATGVPPGFSEGDRWTFPLISPLEPDMPLLVPVEIEGRGPYIFAIDPDAPVSRIDQNLVDLLALPSDDGPDYIDENDTGTHSRLARVARLSIGELTIRQMELWIAFPGTFHVGGHAVKGVLGKDVLKDSLAFGFDRAAGVAWLASQEGFTPPAGAIAIQTVRMTPVVPSPMPAVARRTASATINGASLTVHVDLGDPHSQLREAKWAALGLAPIELDATLIDEAGGRRTVEAGATGAAALHADLAVETQVFVPYVEQRWTDDVLDGALGLDHFAGRAVALDFHDDTLHVSSAPAVDPAARIARWGSAIVSGCPTPACATATLITPEAPGAKPIATVTRTAEVTGFAFELLVEARGADGAPLPLPKLIAIIPKGADKVTQLIDERFAGATLAVVDVSPLPRTCEKPTGCLYLASE